MTFLARVIERGLVRDGRLVQLTVRIADQPGALAQLTGLLGRLRANILQVSQTRAFRHATLGEADVELSLETRGEEHVAELVSALVGEGYSVHRDEGWAPPRPGALDTRAR